MDAVARSICIYDLILADIRGNYLGKGGGGITAILQNSTTSYTARISQEGRVDLRTYEIGADKDAVPVIAKITEETQSR